MKIIKTHRDFNETQHCGERLNQRVNVNVGRGSGHRTLGCDVRSVELSRVLAHTGERREPDSRHRDTELCTGVSEE